jgi:hypothetical protein
MEEAHLKKSDWMLIGVDGLQVRINKHLPLHGSCTYYFRGSTGITSKKLA